MSNENKKDVVPQPISKEEMYARMEDENWRLKAEINQLREQNDLLRRLVNSQTWLIDEYQRLLGRAGYANINSKGV